MNESKEWLKDKKKNVLYIDVHPIVNIVSKMEDDKNEYLYLFRRTEDGEGDEFNVSVVITNKETKEKTNEIEIFEEDPRELKYIIRELMLTEGVKGYE